MLLFYMERHKRISTAEYNFNVTHKTTIDRYGKPFQHFIYLGGNKKGCVHIIVDEPHSDERLRQMFPPNVANLLRHSHLLHDPQCSLDKTLVRGDGTRYMLKAALSWVKLHFDYVEKYELMDASRFECDGISVSLPHYSVALYGETWYERHFKAQLRDQTDRVQYDEGVKRFKGEKPPFEIAFRNIDADLATIRPIYEDKENTTLIAVFAALKSKYPKTWCNLTYEWVNMCIRRVEINGDVCKQYFKRQLHKSHMGHIGC